MNCQLVILCTVVVVAVELAVAKPAVADFEQIIAVNKRQESESEESQEDEPLKRELVQRAALKRQAEEGGPQDIWEKRQDDEAWKQDPCYTVVDGQAVFKCPDVTPPPTPSTEDVTTKAGVNKRRFFATTTTPPPKPTTTVTTTIVSLL